MRSSVKRCMAALQIQGASAERLRFETRAFLMEQNNNSSTMIAKLDSEKLRELAVKFLETYGLQHFPPCEPPRPVWGLNNEQIIRQITCVMECQRRFKIKGLETSKIIRREGSMTHLDSESDAEPTRRRMATADLAYHPGGDRYSNRTLTKQYRTRSNAQPGMPPMPSIESDDGYCAEGDRSRKRRRTTSSEPRLESRMASCLADSVVASPPHRPRPIQVPQHNASIRVDIPVRDASHLELYQRPVHTGTFVPKIVEASDDGNDDKVGPDTRDGSPGAQPLPFSSQPSVNFDRSFGSRSMAATASEQDVRISITVPAVGQCELTPPPSSGLQSEDEDEGRFTKTAMSHRRRHATAMEPDDLKNVTETDQAHSSDEDPPESTTIDLGNNFFRVIDKNRAVKVLQKLVDSQLDELKYCQRGAHQASSSGRRKIFELRTKHLSKLLQSIREDETIWLGGTENDRAVAML